METAASELTDVRSRIPQIRIRVSGPSTLLKVVLDDQEVKDGEVARVNPGVHAVRASRGGTVVFERKLEI